MGFNPDVFGRRCPNQDLRDFEGLLGWKAGGWCLLKGALARD